MTRPVTHARKATGGSDAWCTPEAVLELVRRIAPIALDPCTSADNPAGAGVFFVGGKENGLRENWDDALPDGGLVYVNPPYSQAKTWARRVRDAAALDFEVVTLVAARPDAAWFYELVWNSADAVCFWRGRLRFVGAPSSAPFPSAVVYHGPRPWAFEAAFHDAGRVVRL